jgi:hypothetical protein
MHYAKTTMGIAAGVMVFGLAAMQPGNAAPITAGAAALKSSVTSDIIDVRWRRRYGWAAGGFATGLAIGALAAPRPYYYDYGPSYYYGPPPAVYSEPYADPNGPARQCWIPTDRDRGYGYYRPC